MERFDPYAVLGVPPTATRREIKRAYRREALRWHPDKNREPGAHERFLRVQRAYELLRRRRRAVDTFRRDADERPPRSPADWFQLHRRGRGGPAPEVHGEGDRAYVERPDYRSFTWMGRRFRNEEGAHGRIAVFVALPLTVLVVGLLRVPPSLMAVLVFGVPIYLAALAFVVATARWGTVRYPWNAPLDFEPGAAVVLVSADGAVPLHSGREVLADTVVVRVRSGTLATVEDVSWHPNRDREAYRVRTAGGREGWAKRENVEAR